jgi:hypothetical protein
LLESAEEKAAASCSFLEQGAAFVLSNILKENGIVKELEFIEENNRASALYLSLHHPMQKAGLFCSKRQLRLRRKCDIIEPKTVLLCAERVSVEGSYDSSSDI